MRAYTAYLDIIKRKVTISMASLITHQCLPLAKVLYGLLVTIGSSNNRGKSWGSAYNRNNANCLYDPAYDWKYTDNRNWLNAGKGLSIPIIFSNCSNSLDPINLQE